MRAASSCLSEELVCRILEGALPEEERPSIERHLDSCEACRALVSEAARRSGSFVDEQGVASLWSWRSELVAGATLGRYTILGLVGKGAMGEVYAAYDSELDRKVAL